MRQHPRNTVDEIRQSTASVREDDLAVLGYGERIREQHINCSATCLVQVVKHELRKVAVHEVRVDRMRGMDEGYSFAAVQFLPDGTEIGVS